MVAIFCINIAIIDLAAVYLDFRASVVESIAALTCSVCTLNPDFMVLHVVFMWLLA